MSSASAFQKTRKQSIQLVYQLLNYQSLTEFENKINFLGVDPVIVLFARVTLSGGRRQWIRSVQRAIHTHDVRSLALAGPKLLSGGKILILKTYY